MGILEGGTIQIICVVVGVVFFCILLRASIKERNTDPHYVKFCVEKGKATSEFLCNFCLKPLGVTTIYNHGRRYHPDCYVRWVREDIKRKERGDEENEYPPSHPQE
jgi:hypothetical protein